MQKLLFSLGLLFSAAMLSAQICSNSQSSIDIEGNNIRARIQNGGDLFTDMTTGQFIPNPGPPGVDKPSTIYAAGIWMGGLDAGGNLKLATVDYRNNATYDYTPGPLNFDGITNGFTCANWDRHFRVTESEVAFFLTSFPLSAAELKSQHPAVAGWPGRGNPYFLSMWGYDLPSTGQALAPFFDANADGDYDPLDGDYPAVQLMGQFPFVPAEIVWCVFNDQNGGAPHTNSQGKALQVEIQLTTWAFNCSDQPVLNNTLFTSHKIINRASEVADSSFLGIWVDVDLGCSSDDYVGCNPSLQTMYAYNQDAVDGQPGSNCNGTPTFSGAAPVQSVTLLNHPLSSFVAPNNSGIGSQPPGTTDPTSPLQFYNYLSGSWRDGTPYTVGGNGYNPGSTSYTDHLYPDDPANPNGWSMCTSNTSFGDRRMLGTTKLGTLFPGQVEEVNTAWAFHPNPSLPCGLGNTFDEVATIRNLYNNGFEGVCSVLKASELPESTVSLYPNPASGAAVLRYGTLRPISLQVFDAAGQWVLEKNLAFEKEETVIETAALSTGIYLVRLVTESGSLTQKMTVVR